MADHKRIAERIAEQTRLSPHVVGAVLREAAILCVLKARDSRALP
jgi:hypothetical protein